MRFTSVARGAEQLALPYRTVLDLLLESGMARPSNSFVDGKPVFDEAEFMELASRPFIDTADCPAAVVVKLGAPRQDVEGRPIGYSTTYDGKTLAEAYRKYWRVAKPHTHIGKALVATYAGFVVGVAEITDAIPLPHSDRVEFVIEPAKTSVRQAFENHRLKTRQGSVVEYIGK